MQPALRVGLVGYGYAGQTLHAPLIRATPGLALAAVASRDAARVQADLGGAVEVTTPEALVRRPDLDLVVIASPNDTHHPLALAALRAGRHVVIDKPFALDAGQAGELVAAARQAQRVLSVFHNRRWDGDFLTLQALLAQGALGRPVEFITHIDRWRPAVRARWREAAVPGAGLWNDLGPHLLDQALVLFGTPDAIWLDQARLREGAQTDDAFMAMLRWSRGPHAGLRARLHGSMLAARPGPRFVLHGTQGSLHIDGFDEQEAQLKALLQGGGDVCAALAAPDWGAPQRSAMLWRTEPGAADPQPAPIPLQPGRWPAWYAALRDAIRGTGPGPVSAADALAVQRLLDAGVRSARERREIALLELTAPDAA